MDIMDIVEMLLRLFFGLTMAFWGLNGFFHWKPIPPASPTIESFVAACTETRFIMPLVKIIEIVCGLCLVLKILVPLSLVVLSPLILVITGLHVFHNPRPGSVLFSTTLPFLILFFWHSHVILRLIH
ncbi:MAG: DoxX family membrane protein [Bdellovibrio sp.]